MAYNLSPRFKEIVSQTPELIGPTYYIIDEIKAIKENKAPFLSKKEKGVNIILPIFTDALYNPNISRKITGGSTIRNKAPRSISANDALSAQYNTYNTENNGRKVVKENAAPVRRKKLYVCSVPYSLEATGPSVPTKMDENGYSFDENGKLFKNRMESFDTTLGPAFYKPIDDRSSKGWGWSKMKCKRNMFEGKDWVPGPGTYNPEKKCCRTFDEVQEQYREMARLYAYLPRTLDIIQKRHLNENLPGPAHYSPQIERPKTVSLSRCPIPFNSTSKRFKDNCDDNKPDPTAFNLRAPLLKDGPSRKAGKFCSIAPRFPKDRFDSSPGPAAYETAKKFGQKCRLTYKTVPFNVGDRRGRGDDTITPGPNIYKFDKEDVAEKCKSSVFKSKTQRFVARSSFKKPGAQAYDISATFNKYKDKKSHIALEVPFLTTAKKGLFLVATSGPSPADFIAHKDMELKGFLMPAEKRFPDVEESAGPGSYMIHPSWDNAVYKSIHTHNLKLKENVLRCKRQRPSATYQEWCTKVTQRKLLKVFENDRQEKSIENLPENSEVKNTDLQE